MIIYSPQISSPAPSVSITQLAILPARAQPLYLVIHQLLHIPWLGNVNSNTINNQFDFENSDLYSNLSVARLAPYLGCLGLAFTTCDASTSICSHCTHTVISTYTSNQYQQQDTEYFRHSYFTGMKLVRAQVIP